MSDEIALIVENPPEVAWDGPGENDTYDLFTVKRETFFCGIEKATDGKTPFDFEYRCEQSPFLALILTRLLLQRMESEAALDVVDSLPFITLGKPRGVPKTSIRSPTVSVFVMKEEARLKRQIAKIEDEKKIKIDQTKIHKTTLYELFAMSTTEISNADVEKLTGQKVTEPKGWMNFISSALRSIKGAVMGKPVLKNAWDPITVETSTNKMEKLRPYEFSTNLRLSALIQVMSVISTLGTKMKASFVELDPKFITVYHDWKDIIRVSFDLEGCMTFSVHMKMSQTKYDFAISNNLLVPQNELRIMDFLLDFLSGGKLKVAVRLLTSDKSYEAAADAQRLLIRLLYESGKIYTPNIGGLFEHYPYRCIMNREIINHIKAFNNAKRMDIHTHNEELPKILTEFRQYMNKRNSQSGLVSENYKPLPTAPEPGLPAIGSEEIIVPGLTYGEVLTRISRHGYGADFFTAQRNPNTVWINSMSEISECLELANKAIKIQILKSKSSGALNFEIDRSLLQDIDPRVQEFTIKKFEEAQRERQQERQETEKTSKEDETRFPPWVDENEFLDSTCRDFEDSDTYEGVLAHNLSNLTFKMDQLTLVMREKAQKGGIHFLNNPKNAKKPVTLSFEAFERVAITSDSLKQILNGNWKLTEKLGNPMAGCIVKEDEIGPKSFIAGGKQGKVYLLVFDRRRNAQDTKAANRAEDTAEYFKLLDEIIEAHQVHKHGDSLAYIRGLLVRQLTTILTSQSSLDLIFIIKEAGEIMDLTNEFASGDEWVNGDKRKALLKLVTTPLPSPLAEDPGLPPETKTDPVLIDKAVDEMMNVFKFKKIDESLGDGAGTALEDFARNLIGTEGINVPGAAALRANVRNTLRRILVITEYLPKELPHRSKKEGLLIEEFMKKKFEGRRAEEAKKYETSDFEIGAIKKFPAVSVAEMNKIDYFTKDSPQIKSSETINELLNTLITSEHYTQGLCPFFIRSDGGFTCVATEAPQTSGVSQLLSTIKEASANPTQFALDLVLKQTVGLESKQLLEPLAPQKIKEDSQITTFLAMELIDGTLANFPGFYATLWNRFYKHMPDAVDKPSYHECLTNALQQVAVGLAYFQRYMQGMHFDFHPGNVFIKICDSTLFNGTPLCDYEDFEIVVGDVIFRIPNLGFVIKIGDMGHAALKIKMGDLMSDKIVRKIPPSAGLKSLAEFISEADQYYALRKILSISLKYIPILQLLAISEIRTAIEALIGAKITSLMPGRSVMSWITVTAAGFVAEQVMVRIDGILTVAKSTIGLLGGVISVAQDYTLDFIGKLKNAATGVKISTQKAPENMTAAQLESNNGNMIYLWIESMIYRFLVSQVARPLASELQKLIQPVRARNSGAFYPGYDLGTLMNGCAYNNTLWLSPVVNYYYQREMLEHIYKYGNLNNTQFTEYGDGFPFLLKLGTNYFYPKAEYCVTTPFDFALKIVEHRMERDVGARREREQKIRTLYKETKPPAPELPPKPNEIVQEPTDYPGTRNDPGIELSEAIENGDEQEIEEANNPVNVLATGKGSPKRGTKAEFRKCDGCDLASKGFDCPKCSHLSFCSMKCMRGHYEKSHIRSR